ncbi:rhodanese-like domain-containing protein [Rhodocytophaga aerolata]|uniref:Rhodanese-like domain-containing protein n=1 Tax=Rhodocytophaga aerolata TaxID=455078 RepID=A0ABT8R5K9_9BACT|nr:rhodanese-like domain-containing protein [Rhodocytophaga aerolata]MDO1447378.1 rhodanese-like domain-containing protein [Rhodocytophaga aerolata]
MKNYIHSIFVFFWIAITLPACTSGEKTASSLEPKVFAEQVNQGIVLDVRTTEEFTESHLPDARNIDYKNEAFKDSIQTLDKSKPYYVYCKSGVRSGKAAEIMREMGFTRVYNMEGGIDAWKKEGMPLNN